MVEKFTKIILPETQFREIVKECQKHGHIQQVAFSVYEDVFTQVCFCCKVVRTTFNKDYCCSKKEDLKDEFCLSDYVTDDPLGMGEAGIPGVVYAHKVREFIRILNENPCDCRCCVMWRARINRRAGSKLIVPQVVSDIKSGEGSNTRKDHNQHETPSEGVDSPLPDEGKGSTIVNEDILHPADTNNKGNSKDVCQDCQGTGYILTTEDCFNCEEKKLR